MNRRAFICAALAAGAMGALARAGASPQAVSGEAFLWNSAEARLIDILAPALSPGRREPYAEEARAALQDVLSSGALSLEDAAAPDRWGRRTVRAYVTAQSAPRRSVQAALAGAGAVRVRPESEDEDFIGELLAIEAEARAAGRGLWARAPYRVFDALDAGGAVGSFSIIEGKVLEAASGGGRLYLNFGADFRKDFTITARSSLARRWKEDGLDLAALTGAHLRARGYVAWINGPSIELTHPRQIEVIHAGGPAL